MPVRRLDEVRAARQPVLRQRFAEARGRGSAPGGGGGAPE